jgi:hypothetical protein
LLNHEMADPGKKPVQIEDRKEEGSGMSEEV